MITYNTKVMNALLDSIINPANVKMQPSVTGPKLNVSEDENGYQMEFLVPGIQKEDVKISVEKGTLTISYEAPSKQEERKMLRHEFKTGSFKRSYYLDEKTNADAIEAKYENGILFLSLPKKEEVKAAAKEITIQ